MADGWRNRYMAPFYALAISFVLVLLLGVAVRDVASAKDSGTGTTTTVEQEPEDPDPAKGIRFSPGQGFPVKSVIVLWGKEKRVVTAAELERLHPDEPVTVCAQLPEGWAAPEANITPEDNVVCWGPLDPEADKYVELPVERK